MIPYCELIESARLVARLDATLTTGDNSYDGTALEVTDENGEELFHVVVDSQGQQQLLFFNLEANVRISLQQMEELLNSAKQTVKYVT